MLTNVLLAVNLGPLYIFLQYLGLHCSFAMQFKLLFYSYALMQFLTALVLSNRLTLQYTSANITIVRVDSEKGG